jgi:hypothetical protein
LLSDLCNRGLSRCGSGRELQVWPQVGSRQLLQGYLSTGAPGVRKRVRMLAPAWTELPPPAPASAVLPSAPLLLQKITLSCTVKNRSIGPAYMYLIAVYGYIREEQYNLPVISEVFKRNCYRLKMRTRKQSSAKSLNSLKQASKGRNQISVGHWCSRAADQKRYRTYQPYSLNLPKKRI